MEISPDNIIFYQSGWIILNATIVFTWLVMVLLVGISCWVTRQLSVKPTISHWQNGLEMIVSTINHQIQEASQQEPRQFLPLVGTLFLFIATANILTIFPGYQSPAGSLSTTVALALFVLVAIPWFGIRSSGLKGYIKGYIEPSPFMLPFQIISEISRTVSLAVRLFGNVMSGSFLVAILLLIVPLFIPAAMQLFGLVIGVIQAYVFAILAMVYIASGMQVQQSSQTHHTGVQE
jgi:F-type H+-transporting ATPase subunit a